MQNSAAFFAEKLKGLDSKDSQLTRCVISRAEVRNNIKYWNNSRNDNKITMNLENTYVYENNSKHYDKITILKNINLEL